MIKITYGNSINPQTIYTEDTVTIEQLNQTQNLTVNSSAVLMINGSRVSDYAGKTLKELGVTAHSVVTFSKQLNSGL